MNLIPDWFFTNEMIKKLYTALYADENILYFNEDSGDGIFCCDGMGISSVNAINSILIIILMKMILILLFLSDFQLGILNLKNAKHFKER